MTFRLRPTTEDIMEIFMVIRLPQILTDAPVTQLMNWGGFSAKKDKTMLPPTFLVEPSKNCFVPDGDKVVPRYGTQKVFQGANPVLDVGTIGGYTKFKNFAGIEMDVKAYREATEGEQVYVLFNGVYVPITLDPNLTLNGTGRIYFSTYTDSNLDLSQSKRIPRLCWVNGYEHSDGTGRVFSWTGGIAIIASVGATTISLPVGQTWRKLGFTENYIGPFTPSNAIDVTVEGVQYSSINLAELDTNTLTIGAHSLTAGMVVTSSVEVDELVAPMDILKQNKNYMYYGNFMYRQWWMSNQFGRPSVTRITESNAQQDDLTIDPTTNYTGIGRNIYKLVITDIHPEVPAIDTEDKEFFGTGANTSNWDTISNAYSGGTGLHIYKMVIIWDLVVTFTGGVVPAFNQGELIVGNTSGAFLKVVDLSGSGAIGVQRISGDPLDGETFTGQSSGTTSPVVVGLLYSNGAFLYKDAVQVTGLTGMLPSGALQFGLVGNQIVTPSQIDNLQFVTSQIGGNNVGDYYQLTIQQVPAVPSQPDDFTWQKNNEAINGPDPVSTSATPIDDGIVVSWAQDEGHNIGDYWIIEVNQIVVRPWANFYYTLDLTSQESVRRPGEGYIYSLPANFWTMDTLEDSIYVNTANGEWGFSSPQLSANLLSEDISFTPLKQVGSSKVLYPYLTGHNRNDLLFIDENKNLTSIGRIVLMEKIQMEDMSDFVRNAFNANSWINGSIVFQDDKTWLTSPEDNIMLCYDERTKYWQPPQYIPNLGLLTIIGTSLYVHSNLNTATRSLNDSTADGDDGVEYEVVARSSTYDHGNRWNKKTANMAFWEGYVDEAPPMKMKVYLDVDGCSGIRETNIQPVYCTDVINHGNFGGGQDGGHEFGGDETHRTNYARYQFTKMGVAHFYFSSLEFSCRAKKHPYEMLSMGINLAQSKSNNKDYRSPESAVDSLLPL